MTAASPWWDRGVHADRRPFLQARGRILAACRRFFAGGGFVEADPAALQVSPGNEAHLHALAVELRSTDGAQARPFYLHTSPEFALKKLLAAGETRLYALAHVFRDREHGPLHHPEFSLLEWYRAHQPYTALMDDCAALLALAAEAAGSDRLVWRGRFADSTAPPERVTVADAFRDYAGIDLLATQAPDGATDRAAFAAMVAAAGIRVAADDAWTDLFARVLVERVEPRLGIGRPSILYEYPVSEAALARPKPGDGRVAERFELYACGVELANAFGELTDADEQRRRFLAEMDLKARVYGERYPIDEDFLAALRHLPPASGSALGFDRLVMLATGARRIEQVLWAPVAVTGPG